MGINKRETKIIMGEDQLWIVKYKFVSNSFFISTVKKVTLIKFHIERIFSNLSIVVCRPVIRD